VGRICLGRVFNVLAGVVDSYLEVHAHARFARGRFSAQKQRRPLRFSASTRQLAPAPSETRSQLPLLRLGHRAHLNAAAASSPPSRRRLLVRALLAIRRAEALKRGSLAEFFREGSRRDVLLFVDNVFRFLQAGAEVSTLLGRMPSALGYQPTLASEMAFFQERIVLTRRGSITSIQAVYVPADDFTDPAPVAIFSHLDAGTVLSRGLASRALYPAVDPFLSTSVLLDPAFIAAAHYCAACGVKQLLQRYKELQDILAILGLEELSEGDGVAVDRARKAERLLTQPFFVAEVFTRVPGRFIPLPATVRAFGAIDLFGNAPSLAAPARSRCGLGLFHRGAEGGEGEHEDGSCSRGQEERGGRGGVSQHRVAGGEGLGRAGPEPEPRGGGEKEGALAPEGAEHGVGRVEEHHLENQPRRGPPRGERGVHTVGREEAARIIKENSVRAVPGDSRQQAIPERSEEPGSNRCGRRDPAGGGGSVL